MVGKELITNPLSNGTNTRLPALVGRLVPGRANSLLTIMPQVLLSPREWTLITSTSLYYTASLIARLLRRQLAYSMPQLLHMYVMSHSANIIVCSFKI